MVNYLTKPRLQDRWRHFTSKFYFNSTLCLKFELEFWISVRILWNWPNEENEHFFIIVIIIIIIIIIIIFKQYLSLSWLNSRTTRHIDCQ